MISLKTYREYYEDVMRRVPGIHSVRVVNVDQDMSDCLKSISSDELRGRTVRTGDRYGSGQCGGG